MKKKSISEVAEFIQDRMDNSDLETRQLYNHYRRVILDRLPNMIYMKNYVKEDIRFFEKELTKTDYTRLFTDEACERNLAILKDIFTNCF